MKKFIALMLAALLICMGLVACTTPSLNSNSNDISYNDIIYKRTEFPNYNLVLLENNKQYIGDFVETYAYGQELPWEVWMLNSEANILFSYHAIWTKPGYVFPDEYGEEFVRAEYVVSSGMLDEYKEEITSLITFEGAVTLEDIIESEPSEIADYTEYDEVRFVYKNHADMAVEFTLCSLDGQYYLNVLNDTTAESTLFAIKAEYVDVLTATVANVQ